MDKRRLYITLVLIGLGIAACIFTTKRTGNNTVTIETAESTSMIDSEYDIQDTALVEERRFPVYICGEVRDPGIYEIEGSVYLYELIDMAGGLTESAAASHIDMVFLITSEESIYIPSLSEVSSDTGNEVFVFPDKENVDKKEKEGKININTADEGKLSTLAGIGEKTAKKIISYREENGPFQTAEDIMKVPGIGESKYAAIKDSICV